jgi:hypothetical protein
MLKEKIILGLARKGLKQKANVVGTGLGYKVKDGKITKEQCILVGVSSKKTLSKLKVEDKIPKTIAGVKTDVIDVGNLEYMWRQKHRPMKIGASCCWVGLTACSAGLPVYGKDGQPYLLMNKHCVAPFGAKVGDDVVNPSPVDGKPKRIGEVTEIFFPEHHTRKDNIDYALVKLDEPMLHEDVAGNRYMPVIRDPQPLMKITKGSRTIQAVRTSSPILSVDFEATVRGKDGNIYTYPNSVLTLNTDENGNSIVEGGCSSSIGFIAGRPSVQTFAGSPMVGVFNKIQNTLDDIYMRFELELFLEPPTMKEGWIALGSWMTFDKTNIIIKSPARFRAEPGLKSETISILAPGTRLQIVEGDSIKDNYKWLKCLKK